MEYRYGMQLRPFSGGAQPKDGYVRTEDNPDFRHGVVVYNRPLTEHEIYSFELIPIGEEQVQKVLEAFWKSLGKYKLEYFKKENIELLEEKIQSFVGHNNYPLKLGATDFKAFEQLVRNEAKKSEPTLSGCFSDLLKQDAVLANDLHMAMSELEFKERLAADVVELKEKYGETNVEKTNEYIQIRINVYLDSRFSTENGIIQKVEKEVRDKLDFDVEEATGRKINEFDLQVESQANVITFKYILRIL